MHPDTIKRFYAAFANRDAEAMAACYAPDVHFSDPAFPNLVGGAAGDMWRMLCGRGKDLRVEVSNVRVDGERVLADWDAWYTFGPQRRPVHNCIAAAFRFNADGLIIEHTDRFDFWTWSRQALGLPGVLMGWTPMLQRAVQGKAAAGLRAFREANAPG